MKKLFAGSALLPVLLVGCGPTEIPELTMKAEYQPSMSIKGLESNGKTSYIAFEEKGNSEKIDVLYSFSGSMFLQKKYTDGENHTTEIGKSFSQERNSFRIVATFPPEFKKYAAGGFKYWEITPIPPTDALYTYTKAEWDSIIKEYKTVRLNKQSIDLSNYRMDADSSLQNKNGMTPEPFHDLKMDKYTVPPAAFRIEAFSELRNVPNFPDQIRSGYGLVKFLYPWRIQFKFFAYPDKANNTRKYQDLRGARGWIDAINTNEKGMNGENIFRIPVLLPMRPDDIKIGLALRLVFNTDYPDDVMAYPDAMKKSLYQKISWQGAQKNNASLDSDFMGYRWNVAVIDELPSNICMYVSTTFALGKNKTVKIQSNIDITDVKKSEVKK